MAQDDDVRTIIKNRTSVIVQTAAPPLTGLNDILEADLDSMINSAIRDYSMDEPKHVLVDKGSGDLALVGEISFYLISDWDFDVSSESEIDIEFPVDLQPLQQLRRSEDLDYTFVERPTGVGGARQGWIKFGGVTPNDIWRISYKTRHADLTTDATLAGLSVRNVQMVGLLGASYVASFLAGKFAKTEDAQIAADVVDYRGRSAEWREKKTELWTEYQDRIDRPSKIKRTGLDVDIVDLDTTLGRSNRYGRQYLVHRRRTR